MITVLQPLTFEDLPGALSAAEVRYVFPLERGNKTGESQGETLVTTIGMDNQKTIGHLLYVFFSNNMMMGQLIGVFGMAMGKAMTQAHGRVMCSEKT